MLSEHRPLRDIRHAQLATPTAYDCCHHFYEVLLVTPLVLWSECACEVKVVLSDNGVTGRLNLQKVDSIYSVVDVRKQVLSMRNYSIDEDRLTAISILVNHWHNRRKHLNKELKDQDALATGKQLFPLRSLCQT